MSLSAPRPIIAIIGRPNVGKSSLFNRLIRRRQAIVSPISGTTRDRLYAPVRIGEIEADLIDTAGLSQTLGDDQLGPAMLDQVQQAVAQADLLIFVLDGQVGLTHDDQLLAETIRQASTPCVIFVNKVDDQSAPLDPKLLSLGIGQVVTGSIAQRRGTDELIEQLAGEIANLPNFEAPSESDKPVDSTETVEVPRIALIGRPNVGKSTLLNALAGDSRVIVSDIPGTTRDATDTLVKLPTGQSLIFTDTAGLRRRGKVGKTDKIERYSVIRTLKTIDQADLVLVLVDAVEGLTRGDVHAAMYALERGKKLITVFNKADLINPKDVNIYRYPFLSRLPMIFVSAKEGLNLDNLLDLLRETIDGQVAKSDPN